MNKAFTLIELLVTSAIIMVIIGGSLVAYHSFSDRQQAQAESKNIVEHLRRARAKVVTVEVPQVISLVGLRGFEVTFSENQVSSEYVANNGTRGPSGILPVEIVDGRIVSTGRVFFSARTGIADTATNIDYCRGANNQYRITINSNGIIDDPIETYVGC